MRRPVLFAAVAGALVAFTTAPAQAASILSAHVPHTISIYARGAAAWVPVTYTCPTRWADGFANTVVTITEQLPDGRIAKAAGETDNHICDGQPHITHTAVDEGLVAFVPGIAAQVWTQISACNADESVCTHRNAYSNVAVASGTTPPSTPLIGARALYRSGTGHAAVRINYRCPPGSDISMGITLGERLRGGIATSSDGAETPVANAQCDNKVHSTLIDVAPAMFVDAPGRSRYEVGSAWAEVHGQTSPIAGGVNTPFKGDRVIDIVAAS